MRKILLTVLLFIGCFIAKVSAQQEPQFTQYMLNGIYFNPAYAGADNNTRFSALQRTQYYGYQATRDEGGQQSTQLITFAMPLPKWKSGVGVHFVNDKIGPVRSTEVQVNLAHHIMLGEGKLSVGIRGGYFSRVLDYSGLIPFENDPNLGKGSISDNNLDFGFGAWYTAEKYYLGLSMARLNEASFNLGASSTFQLRRTTYLTGGYTIQINDKLKATPSALITTDFKDVSKFDIGGLVTYQDQYFGGINFRSGVASYNNVSNGDVTKYTVSDIGIIAGISFLKNNAMRVAYSFDAVLPNAEALAPTSHEISLSYVIPSIARTPRPIIRSPRYRR